LLVLLNNVNVKFGIFASYDIDYKWILVEVATSFECFNCVQMEFVFSYWKNGNCESVIDNVVFEKNLFMLCGSFIVNWGDCNWDLSAVLAYLKRPI